MDGDGIEKEYGFAVYINPNREKLESKRDLDVGILEDVIRNLKPIGPWRVSKTWCGLLAAFCMESDALDLLNTPLKGTFGSSVQLAKFCNKDVRSKQILLLRDVPWAVPLLEIKATLEKQGIFPLSIERLRQNIKIEVSDTAHYDTLLRNGLDFFGVTRFSAVPERWRRPTTDLPPDSVIQCYRCQNLTHTHKYIENLNLTEIDDLFKEPIVVKISSAGQLAHIKRPKIPIRVHKKPLGRRYGSWREIPAGGQSKADAQNKDDLLL